MNPLVIWTVYDHPIDYPDCFLARRFLITAGEVQPTRFILTSPDLVTLRRKLRGLGLTAIARNAADSPGIVETWL